MLVTGDEATPTVWVFNPHDDVGRVLNIRITEAAAINGVAETIDEAVRCAARQTHAE